MAYEKGAFAFFNGSSSEFSKVLKANGVIAGHKLVDVLADAVKLEADGKILDLSVGSSMRREDEGTWHLGEAVPSNGETTYASNPENGSSSRSDSGSRYGRSSRRESASEAALVRSNSNTDELRKEEKQQEKELKKELKQDSKAEAEILKRLMERREKESQ